MKKRTLKLNITQKFIGYLVFVSLIPILVVAIFSYNVSYILFLNQATQSNLRFTESQKEKLDLQLQQIHNLIGNLSGVQTISDIVNKKSSVSDRYNQLNAQAQIGYILNGYLNLNGLVSIDIFTKNGDHYHVGDTLDGNNTREDIKTKLFKQISDSEHEIFWAGIEENINASSSQGKVITIVKKMTRINLATLEQEPNALLVINISIDSFFTSFNNVNLGEGSYLMILDQQNRMIFHPDKSQIGKQYPFLIDLTAHAEDSNWSSIINGEQMLISRGQSKISGWTILSFTPISTFTSQTSKIGNTTFIIILLCLGYVAVAAWIYNRDVVAPIKKITNLFKSIEKGTLDWKIRLEPRGSGEISDLVNWFNTFIENVVSAKQLKESEERYRLTAKAANDGLWDWNLTTNDIYFSPRWKSVLGYEDDELGNSPEEWFNRVHSEDFESLQQALALHIKNATPILENEHRILHKNGSYRWVFVRGIVVSDHNHVAVRIVGSHTDIDERKQAEEKLRHDAFHDGLTSLPNRALFMDRLERSFLRIKRNNDYMFAVLFLDLDRFKDINDSLGHDIGDKLLVEISRRLEDGLRTVDTIARLGGDEFVIILEDILNLEAVEQVADRILNYLGEPHRIDDHEVMISTSIGIVLANQAYHSAGDILRDADIAMYQAKSLGKACYRIFNQSMREKIIERVELEADLRKSIDHKELFLVYQPLKSLEDQSIIGFEALIRWIHPKLGIISPEKFIPIAEETGLIIPIGEWVLSEACKQIVEWQSDYQQNLPLSISVNISSVQLSYPGFVNRIIQIVEETKIPPSSLILEVTESAIIKDVDNAIRLLSRLKEFGLRIHMDDFGTGYSSLSNLRNFPINAIKIDRSFVMDLDTNKNNAGVVRAIILMAHELGMKVIAEGIETEKQLIMIKEMSCEFGQGYYFSRPIPVREVANFIAEESHHKITPNPIGDKLSRKNRSQG